MLLKQILSSLLGLIVVVCYPLYADDHLAVVAPAEVGFDANRLKGIDTFFQHKVDDGELAGIVTLVARHGKIVHHSAVGYLDVQREIPMRTDSIFRIYSMTKAIATTALMQLYEEGRFQLRDPVSRYIPEFANLRVLRSPDGPLDETVAMEREPTVQDLLRHTAGLSHGLDTSEYDERFVGSGVFDTDTSLEEMIALLSDLPLMNQPGSQYRYSVGPDVALRLVEVLSGMRADEYLASKLFAPLEMTDTGYWVDSDNASRLGPVHWMRNGELVPIDNEYNHPAGGVLVQPWSVNSYTADHGFNRGSYGLLSTAEDYWKFTQAMLDGGILNGERILGSRTVDFMASNHLTKEQISSSETGFGLGFAVVTEKGQLDSPFSEGTFLWGGAAATIFWIDPEEDLVVVGMTQHMAVPGTGTGDIIRQLAALVYGAIVD
jgi:CubicO group peptidase (beta-lactamase class C family)